MPERRAAPAAWRRALPGLSICLVAATAAARVSEQYGPPIFLMGLLIGLSLNFLTANPATHLGLEVASKTCLRWGIVIPGFQVTLGQIGQAQFAITLVAISLTSAIAMLAYPPLADLLQLSDRQAGFLVGASIPDVARAVGRRICRFRQSGQLYDDDQAGQGGATRTASCACFAHTVDASGEPTHPNMADLPPHTINADLEPCRRMIAYGDHIRGTDDCPPRTLRSSGNIVAVRHMFARADLASTAIYAHAMTDDVRNAMDSASPVKVPTLEAREATPADFGFQKSICYQSLERA